MKTIKQIKQLVESIAISCNGKVSEIDLVYSETINSVRDKYLPFLQFNIDGKSSENAQELFRKISENVQKACSVPFLPDGRNTVDKIGEVILETPTIIEWQSGKDGKNIVTIDIDEFYFLCRGSFSEDGHFVAKVITTSLLKKDRLV